MINATAHTLSEDDIYRASSQYRVWSFSPERLTALRRSTHELAIELITAHRERESLAQNGADSVNIAFLDEEEELQLVRRYCEQLRTTSDHFKWPANVKATAVQYLRRFYVSNSVMVYPPKEIYKTALFLACKSEATHMTLSEYARRISSQPEEILAVEYKLMQALRFTLDVKQPFRGLKGILMELLNIADEDQARLSAVAEPSSEATSAWHGGSIQDRIQAAYSAARAHLDQEALLTDVYFLYTPSQILFAALLRADPELADFYISTRIPSDSAMRPRVMASIRSCADMLAIAAETPVLTKDERAAMEAKLELCRDPNTRDMVKLHLAKKAGDRNDEEKMEKRRADRERQQKEGDDLFGPSLTTNGTTGG